MRVLSMTRDGTLSKKMDDVTKAVKGIDTRMTKSEELIADVQKAVEGTVVSGSEEEDAGTPVRKNVKAYVPQDFDTGFDRNARARFKVA